MEPDALGRGRDADALERPPAWPALGTGPARWIIRGSLSALNAALEGLSYTPPPGFDGGTALRWPASRTVPGRSSHWSSSPITGRSLPRDHDRPTAAPARSGRRFSIPTSPPEVINTIDFDIAGPASRRSPPISPLPAITQCRPDRRLLAAGLRRHAADRAERQPGRRRRRPDITGSDVTVRGLDINGFADGAGILISGPAATGEHDRSQRNRHRSDRLAGRAQWFRHSDPCRRDQQPRGRDDRRRRQPDRVQHAAGRRRRGRHLGRQPDHRQSDLRQRQSGEPSNSTARPTSACPTASYAGFEQAETIEASFRTTSGGVILGYQNTNPFNATSNYVPMLYVGTDGKLHAELQNGSSQFTSDVTVNDGRWHDVALVVDGHRA